MNKTIKTTSIVFIALSFVGILDSFYLVITKLSETDAACSILEGCDVVLNSSYSMVGPIPLAVFGFMYYLFIFFASLYFLSRPQKIRVFVVSSWLTAIGFLFSLYFTYLQAFVLEAYCTYCLTSALISTVLFIFGMKFLLIDRKQYEA